MRKELCLALALGACSSPPAVPETPPVQIQARVMDQANRPLAGAFVREGGLRLGPSDAEGRMPQGIAARIGERLELELRCPEGYRALEPRRALLLRDRRSLSGARREQQELSLRCERRFRRRVVVVRSSLPELPIELDGIEVARSDERGLAHLMVEGLPGQRHVLAIMSEGTKGPGGRPMQPINPERRFEIGTEDELLLVDELFVEAPPVRRPRRRRRARAPKREAPAPRRPQRID